MNNSTQDDPLKLVQDRFAIIDLEGELRVIDLDKVAAFKKGQSTNGIPMYKRDAADILIKRHLESTPIQSDPKKVITQFWTSGNTKLYNQIAFTPAVTDPSTLNYWVGPKRSAGPSSWLILRDYLRDIVCAADREIFEYLLCYLAHMIQKPEEKPGVMIVLLGGQGIGKGVFFQLLNAIWTRTTLSVSDVDQVTGRFNAALERAFVVCMDEALFAGDKKAMDRLKSMVTEPQIKIEQKYQPQRRIESVHRFFAASNHSHFASIDKDDRRFLFLRVSEARKQDTTYFRSIVDAINDPKTLGGFIYYLEQKDLSNVDVRDRPLSSEHSRQKIQSLHGFDRYWYEVLNTGVLDPADDIFMANLDWGEPRFIATKDLVKYYRNYVKGTPKYDPIQTQQVKESLLKLCPSATPSRQSTHTNGSQSTCRARGVYLPTLDRAREEFCNAIGDSIQWD